MCSTAASSRWSARRIAGSWWRWCALLADGGVTVAEITMTVPGALDVLRQVRQALGERVLLGAGTILDTETARAALLAGAEYVVAPTVNVDVDPPVPPLRQARDARRVHTDGDPRRVGSRRRHRQGISGGGGRSRVLQGRCAGPLPQIRLMPTGGVDLTTAAAFLKAGACCLGTRQPAGRARRGCRRQFRSAARSGPPVCCHRTTSTSRLATVRRNCLDLRRFCEPPLNNDDHVPPYS